jgi:hypothetical protein
VGLATSCLGVFILGWSLLFVALRSYMPGTGQQDQRRQQLRMQDDSDGVPKQERLLHQLKQQLDLLEQWQQQRSQVIAGSGEPMMHQHLQQESQLLTQVQGQLGDLRRLATPPAPTTRAPTTTVTTVSTTTCTTVVATTQVTSPPPTCAPCSDFSTGELSAQATPQKRWAFVMMSHDEPGKSDHLMGVLAMARALQRLSSYPLVLLTNATHFPDGTPVVEGLAKLNVQILPVYPLGLPKKFDLMFSHWKVAFWKLQIWNLVQFEKLIWLDSDAILYRSIDWLFERSWMWAQRDDWFCKLEVEKVCSGIMLLFPSKRDYQGLLEYAKTLDDMNDGDQQLIALYFERVRHKPINLLSDLEAAFGQCLGSAPTPYINPDKSAVWGVWDTPTFVHKSGGWKNTNENAYSNVCFSHNMQHQRYTIGSITLNVCHYHPLGAYWRNLFCEATRKLGLTNLPDVESFCSDACWYAGRSVSNGGNSCGPISATINYADYSAKKPGLPG